MMPHLDGIPFNNETFLRKLNELKIFSMLKEFPRTA